MKAVKDESISIEWNDSVCQFFTGGQPDSLHVYIRQVSPGLFATWSS